MTTTAQILKDLRTPVPPALTYEQFVARKVTFDQRFGHTIDPAEVHQLLKPHQRALVAWAVAGGRRAVFASYGLGKSLIQLEVLRLTLAHHGDPDGRALIICPLSVRLEFAADAAKIGLDLRFVRRTEDLDGPGLYVTNYESVRDGRLDVNAFTAVSLDEASVLRSFGSKTYQEFLAGFSGVPYRYVATATPSPNRHKELIHYAGFLGIMDTGQALTRFFQRDSTQAGNLTLYPHKEREFWLWLNTWAAFLSSPADLGHDATGYDLPPLEAHWHEISVDHALAGEERDGQGLLYRGGAMGVVDAAREKRETIEARIDKMMEIVHGYFPRGEEREAAGVLPPQPRGATGGAEGAGRPEGPRGEAGLPPRLLGSEPGEAARAAARAGSPELPGQPREVRRAGQEGSAEEVRPDAGGVHPVAGAVPGPMRDLRATDGAPGGGSRPLDRSVPGHSLQQLQHGARRVPGQPADLATGDRLPGEVADQLIIWCDLNAEQRLIEQRLTAAGITYSSVYGSLTPDEAERRLEEWKARRTTVLVGKPVMLGQGMNLQQANKAIFVGISHRYNDFAQALHRIQRFGQTRTCHAHIIHAESEVEIKRDLIEKWTRHEELTATMTSIVREHGLDPTAINEALQRSLGVDRVAATGDGWAYANNDCVHEVRDHIDTDSVDLIVTSIPFANHYEYTPAAEDFGHTDDNAHFWGQMDYLTPELLRVLAPGRIYACHVKDRINFGNVTGAGIPTVSPFHVEAILHAQKHGFDYLGMITVVTDVVRENNQTYRLSWSEQCKDATKMGVGSPEYVLLFHKPQTDRTRGYADTPVTKTKDAYTRARWQIDAHAFWRSSGDRLLTPDELVALPVRDRSRLFTEQTLREVYDYETHVRIGEDLDARGALPATFMSLAPGSADPYVWHDVNRMRTLNGDQKQRNLAMHVCPLQIDIVDRLINRFSNPGDLVLDPFGGLGTVPYRALHLGRRGRGVELNPGYYLDALKYLHAAEQDRSMPSLFDLLDGQAAS